MKKYFYTDGKDKFGPYSKDELKTKNISRSTKIWCSGMSDWEELSQIIELEDIKSNFPPHINKVLQSSNSLESKHSQKQKIFNNSFLKIFNKKYAKWLAFTILIALLFIIFKSQNEPNLHNQIAANSFETGESFDIYLDKFYRDLELYGIFPQKPSKTIIKFSKLDQLKNTTHIHAVSFGIYNDDIIEIYINPSSWKSFNKPMRYFLMYHELAHDILNVDDLEKISRNEGKLMYPEISSYENKNMDDFIESFHSMFESHSSL